MRPRAPKKIADILGRPGPFYRSDSIERDRLDRTAMRGYVLTPWLERVAAEILEGLLPGSRRRAWRITGDFGVGKSALALALIRTLEAEGPDPELPMARVVTALGQRPPCLYPLVLSGSREGFAAGLARAIAKARDEERGLIDAAKSAKKLTDPVQAVIRL